MYMIEISENKFENLSENIEKALRYAGKAMQVIDEMQQGRGRYNERNDDYDDYDDGMSRYGGRMENRYGNRYGNRGGGYGRNY